MAEEKEIPTLSFSDLAEETNADTEKKPAKKMNFVFEILRIKKQLRWVIKNMNIVLGTDKNNEYPVVKYYKGKLDPSGTVEVKDLIKKHETDSCYDICVYIPSKEVLAELAKNKDDDRFTKVLNHLNEDGNIVLKTGETITVPTNICFDLPHNIECQCRPRSGLTSQGITVGWGTVDEDYRGDVGIIITNTSGEDFIIKSGERIAQIYFNRKTKVTLEDHTGEEISKTERGDAGFGSTGK